MSGLMRTTARRTAARLAAATAAALCWLCLLVAPGLAAVSIQNVVSPKGVHAWLVEDASIPLITIRFSFEGGTAQDPLDKQGLVNLMTGLFDEGAGNLDSEAYHAALDAAGAEMSFTADRDRIYGAMRMLAADKDDAFRLLRLAVNEPRFDAGPVNRIRAQIIDDIVSNSRDPETKAGIELAKALYGDHPYAKRSEGTRQTLANVTPADLKTFHQRIFARDTLHVAVVGDIDAETLKTELDKLFGSLPAKPDLMAIPDIKPRLDQRIHVTYPLPQTQIELAYRGVSRHAPDFYAAYLMNQILGGIPFSSRLFHQVREKRGLAYGISSTLVDHEHATALVIGTATRSQTAGETLKIVRDQVQELADKGATAAELAAAKKYVIGAFPIHNLDSSQAIARTLLDLQNEKLGIDYIEKRIGFINAVTLDQVDAAARKLFSVAPAILIVGPALQGTGKG